MGSTELVIIGLMPTSLPPAAPRCLRHVRNTDYYTLARPVDSIMLLPNYLSLTPEYTNPKTYTPNPQHYTQV